MTKRELINLLESLPVPDDMPVYLADWNEDYEWDHECNKVSVQDGYSSKDGTSFKRSVPDRIQLTVEGEFEREQP